MPRIRPLLLAITIPAAPLAAQATQKYQLRGSAIEVYNLVGSARIEAASGGNAEVEVTRGGADAAKLKVETDAGSLRVIFPADRVRYSHMDHGGSTTLRVAEDGTFDDHHGRGGRRVKIARDDGDFEAWADLRIAVPEGRSLELHLAVGRVAASNLNGRLRVQALSASVSVTGGRGELSVATGSGDVTLSGGSGPARLSTGSGEIELSNWGGGEMEAETGSGDVTATDIESLRLRAQTGSGDVLLSGVRAPDVGVQTGSGNVTLELQSVVQQLDVETGSGDVSVVAPPSTSARLDIETGSGDIESDFPLAVTRSGRHHLTGTIGDGKGRVSIGTGSGEVRLLRAKGA
jgi:DUF4097 and DUF4098 domain-containing protein YvlB